MSSSEIYDGGLKFQINQPPNKEDQLLHYLILIIQELLICFQKF